MSSNSGDTGQLWVNTLRHALSLYIYSGNTKLPTEERAKTNLMQCGEKGVRHTIWKMQIQRKLYSKMMQLLPLYTNAIYDKNTYVSQYVAMDTVEAF